jgi:ketosteroid isomerase-like protein
MAARVSRKLVDAFFEVLTPLDSKKLGTFLADDVEWTITGPIELLQFCGQWRGKAVVMEVFERIIPTVFKSATITPQVILVDGDRAGALCRVSGMLTSGRAISYHTANFMRFQRNKIVEYRAIFDSFNAAEQVIGRPFDLPDRLAQPEGVVVISDKVPV